MFKQLAHQCSCRLSTFFIVAHTLPRILADSVTRGLCMPACTDLGKAWFLRGPVCYCFQHDAILHYHSLARFICCTLSSANLSSVALNVYLHLTNSCCSGRFLWGGGGGGGGGRGSEPPSVIEK